MRLEDVREGMWLRFGLRPGDVGRIGPVDPGSLCRWVDCVDGSRKVLTLSGVGAAVPWVPRVGEWVRFRESVADARNPGRKRWAVTSVKRAVYAGSNVGSDGLVHYEAALEHLEPCFWALEPLFWVEDPVQADISRMKPKKHGPAMEAAVKELAALARPLSPAEIAAVYAQPPRDHNTTCSRCGGRAYQGIGLARCIEPVCDDPNTREPERVWSSIEEDERVWTASGRGVSADHPLREGAIAAWREAVR